MALRPSLQNIPRGPLFDKLFVKQTAPGRLSARLYTKPQVHKVRYDQLPDGEWSVTLDSTTYGPFTTREQAKAFAFPFVYGRRPFVLRIPRKQAIAVIARLLGVSHATNRPDKVQGFRLRPWT